MSTSSDSVRKWTTKGADNSSLVLIVKDLREVYLRAKFLRLSSILYTSKSTDHWMYVHASKTRITSFLLSKSE